MGATLMINCNGCTLCCDHDIIILHPENGDDPSKYETIEIKHPLTGKPALAIKPSEDGSCRYVVKGKGCTIYDERPAVCKEFDCGRLY